MKRGIEKGLSFNRNMLAGLFVLVYTKKTVVDVLRKTGMLSSNHGKVMQRRCIEGDNSFKDFNMS